jgi:predicted MFS family arabinose efflux permease
VAKTFSVSIGTASQIGLVVNLVSLALGFAMGALTLKFKHKSLFLAGITFYGVGALGFYFAPNFATALLVHVFSGIGTGMTPIMVYSLIGGLFPLEKRGWTIGLTFSSSFLAFVIAAPLFGKIEEMAGWRSILLWFSFPFSIICLILGLLVIPAISPQPQAKSPYSQAFREILLNKSAVACLAGTTLIWIFTSIPFYAVSFYRIHFSVAPSTGGIFSAIAATGGIFGSAIGGRFVNQCGRKTLTVIGALISGLFGVLFTFMPDMRVSVAFWAVSASFAALTMGSLTSLILEQVPRFRASMMSVNGTFQAFGSILGLVIGGLVLNLYSNNFQLLMTIFGASNIALGSIIFLFAKDPCKTQPIDLPATTI